MMLQDVVSIIVQWKRYDFRNNYLNKLIIMTQDKIIVLKTFNSILEANLAQDKLKENGINSFFENENPIGLNPLGGIELKIFLNDKEKADIVIMQS